MSTQDAARVRWILALGLASLSFAAILVRYCKAPALVIAFWRMALATLMLILPLLFRLGREPVNLRLNRSFLPHTLGAGLILALHFGTWIASIQLTTISSSLLLMSAQPVWAALLGVVFLRESVPRRGTIAIALSLAGVVLIGWGDLGRGATSLLGDALALVSGMAAAGYLTVGRHVKERLPLLHYLVLVYGASALFLGLGVLGTGGSFTGYAALTWVMFVLLAFFPSALGHTLVNYAIRHIESYRVNLSILVEPVVSSILAAILFAEIPGGRFYVGAILVFAGVLLALFQGGASRLEAGLD